MLVYSTLPFFFTSGALFFWCLEYIVVQYLVTMKRRYTRKLFEKIGSIVSSAMDDIENHEFFTGEEFTCNLKLRNLKGADWKIKIEKSA